MSRSKSKRDTFFGGAAILAAAVALTKVIGAIYKIPLMSILSDSAYADFDSAYSIYNFFLTTSTAGLPVALSKTISEANTLGRQNQSQKVFRVAFTAFLTLGLISFFCMTVLAVPMANLVAHNPKSVYCVLALAPSVLCVCVMSAFRGYFQGHFNMQPTAISQVIESLLKLVVGLGLAVLFVKLAFQPPDFGERMPAVGAIIGVSTGSVAALVYLVAAYLRHRGKLKNTADEADSSRRIFIDLLKLAVPITIGMSAQALVTLIDGNLVMTQLQRFYMSMQGMAFDPALNAARALKGIYSKTITIYNLPFSMMVPLTACIIPAVSGCLARRDHPGAQRISESALRIGLLLALPMGMGLFALGGPIMGLLARDVDTAIAGPLLSLLGIASVFVALQLICNSILQAYNMLKLPILVVAVGGVVKIIVNYTLVGNPEIRINGAPVGTICCFAVMSILDLVIIRRRIPSPPRFLRSAVKPLIASVIMAGAAWGTYGLLRNYLGLSNSLACVGGILSGAAIYFVLVIALRAITKEDLALMPKGDKIARLLHLN